MAKDIYRAGDVQGYDFAFDAAGQLIDWSPVTRAAKAHSVKLDLSLGMLFTEEGEVSKGAKARVTIPRGADETTVRQRVYAGIRSYVRNVARRVQREQAEEEGEEYEVGDTDADTSTPGTVALISAVTMS